MALRVETQGEITTVILDRPQARNAVDPAIAGELREAFQQFDRDPSTSVAVLWGDSGSFCAGYDLQAVAAGHLEKIYEPDGDGPLGISRMTVDKPVIAAISGYAVAGGLELALWCDMRVMERSAQVGVFCRRWGVPLVDGGTVRLPRIVGMGHAMDLILTGRPCGAQEALGMGLCNRVVDDGTSRQAAEELAQEIAAFPQVCMRTDRRSAYEQFDLSLEQALRNEGRNGEAPLLAEAAAGATRFAQGAGRSGSFSDEPGTRPGSGRGRGRAAPDRRTARAPGTGRP